MRIRRMTENDLPEAAAIEKLRFSEPWSEAGFRASLASEDTIYLVCEADAGDPEDRRVPSGADAGELEAPADRGTALGADAVTGWNADALPGKILGYAGLLRSFEEADITNVAVHPACEGRGIGTALVDALMEEGREAGIERFTLEVRVSNQPAIHVYEKLGFHAVGTRRGFYAKPREDALILWTT